MLHFGGLPVPYTAMWSEEARLRDPVICMWRCEGVKRRFVSDGVNMPGAGKPLFKALHADRCREMLDLDACQMCRQQLGVVRTVMSYGATLQGGRPLISDGLPMHAGCAMIAYLACPGLRRRQEEGKLRIHTIQKGGYTMVPKVLGISHEPGSSERINEMVRRHGTVCAGPDLVLTDFRAISLADMMLAAGGTIGL